MPEDRERVAQLLINRWVLSRESLRFFCMDVLGLDYEAHHKEWQMLADKHQYLLIEAHRDSGKSWFWAMAYPISKATFKQTDTLIISYSLDQVMDLTGRIKRHLENNEFFNGVIPSDYRDTWTKTNMRLANGSIIKGESFGSSVRGGHYDLIIVDDPIKDYAGMSKEDQLNFFYSVLFPALKPNGQLIVVGTPIEFNDLLETIETNPLFQTYKFPAIKDGSPLWPARYTIDELNKRKGLMGSWKFAREYMLERISPETAPLKTEWLKYYDNLPETTLQYFLTIDPAINTDTTADYSACIVTAVTPEGVMYVVEAVRRRLNPHDLMDLIFTLQAKWRPILIGLETVAFQKVLKFWLLEEGRRRGVFLPIKELTHGTRKVDRIMRLQPRMETGRLYLRSTMVDLIDEMSKFRLDTDNQDDLLDALASMEEVISSPEVIKKDPYADLSALEQRVWRARANWNKEKPVYDPVLGEI